jgi:hypothetical protein
VQIHEREKEEGVRRIQGVLALARKFGTGPVDDACAAGLAVGVPSYRFVRRYLERHPATTLTVRQVDPLIRQLTQYRDLINRLTEKEHRDESR